LLALIYPDIVILLALTIFNAADCSENIKLLKFKSEITTLEQFINSNRLFDDIALSLKVRFDI
jgi:hypothetical protein